MMSLEEVASCDSFCRALLGYGHKYLALFLRHRVDEDGECLREHSDDIVDGLLDSLPSAGFTLGGLHEHHVEHPLHARCHGIKPVIYVPYGIARYSFAVLCKLLLCKFNVFFL